MRGALAPLSVSSLEAWERSSSRKAYTIDAATIGDILLGAQANGDASKLEARSDGTVRYFCKLAVRRSSTQLYAHFGSARTNQWRQLAQHIA